MIKVIDGNLLNSNAEIICHQVNCQGKMNSGIAKQIREKYPEVYYEYKHLCETYINNPKNLLGICQLVKIENRKYVANLFGQLNYGYDKKQYTDTEALKESMLFLKEAACSKKYKTIAFPWKIGCVRGGANWDEVYKIILEVFEDYNVELWVFDKG